MVARKPQPTHALLELGTASSAAGTSVGAHEVCDPVGFPSVVVIRKRLLPTSMIAIELVPGETDFHGTPAVHVLAIELAVVAIEAAHDRRFQPTTRTAHPIDRPLVLFDIERAQREP